MNWARVRIAIQMVILVTLGIWAMNCEITCCKKDPSTPPGSTPSGDDGGPVSGGGTGSTTATNNLVDWTQPVHGEIMRPPLTYLFIHFLTEENDNPNDDIDRNSFSVSDDVVLTAMRGGSAVTPDISIDSEIYWGWGGVMMLISGGGSVDTTYTFKIKKNGVTPIRTISGITMNLDVYVSITLKNGDGVPPTITSSTFDTLNLNYVPPHQPIEYFFSEDMSNARIVWLATKQGGQSVADDPNKQVIGWYDHLGGYRFTVYNLGAGLDLDNEYEYTILGADMDPSLKLFLPPTMDPTGERMRNTHTKRFRTSKVKITSPSSSSVRVIVGGQETDIIPTITDLPVKVGIQTSSGTKILSIKNSAGNTTEEKIYFESFCRKTETELWSQITQVFGTNNTSTISGECNLNVLCCALGASCCSQSIRNYCKLFYELLNYNYICNNITVSQPPEYYEKQIYFRTPGINTLITSVMVEQPCPPGEGECLLPIFGGYDYIKVNVQPPEKQVVANVGILNYFAQQFYLTCKECVYEKVDQIDREGCPGIPGSADSWSSQMQLHPEFSSVPPEITCRTIWMDKYYTINGKEVPPPLLTSICLIVKALCSKGEAECQEEFNRCNKFEHIDNCKVDRCWLPAGAVVDPNDPQWSAHFVDMCNNYGGTLETDRTEKCERDESGNFKIVYYNPTNNIIYHHKRLDWNINKGVVQFRLGPRLPNLFTIITADAVDNRFAFDRIKVNLGISYLEIQNGMAYIDSGTICSGYDLITSVEGYMQDLDIHFNIKPYVQMDADGVKRIKFDIPESGGSIGIVELKDHNDLCDSLAKDYLEGYYFPRHVFRETMKRMFLEGDRPLLQSAIFWLFGLEGLPTNPNHNLMNPDNLEPRAFNSVGYRNLDDIYFNSLSIDEGQDSIFGLNYEKVNLKANYLWGLRPNY